MNKNKLNENQINELYNYLLELIKDKDVSISMDEFLVFMEKSYKCNDDIESTELFDVVKESIEKVVGILKRGE